MYFKILFTFVHNATTKHKEKFISCGENLHNTENMSNVLLQYLS